MNRAVICSMLAVVGLEGAGTMLGATFTFAGAGATDGGWVDATVVGETVNPFTWDSLIGWYAQGLDIGTAGTEKTLTSPQLTVTGTAVTITVVHDHNWDVEGINYYDGGQLQYRVNAGTWTTLDAEFTQGGYTANLNGLEGNPLGTERAWSGSDSLTSVATISTGLAVNDSLTFRFRAGWGADVTPPGNDWVIASVDISNTMVPEPQEHAVLAGLGLLGMVLYRRLKGRSR